jgi:hypothetical protein
MMWCMMRDLLTVLSLLIPCTAVAQQVPQPAVFHPAQVVLFRDSFDMLIQGEQRGTHVYAMERTATGYSYQEAFALKDFGDRQLRVDFDGNLAPVSSRSTGSTFGRPSGHDLTYQGRTARGQRIPQGPSSSPAAEPVPVEATLAPGVIDGNALMGLLPSLAWKPGLVYSIAIYDVDEDRTTTQELRLGSVESLVVPAGRFEAIGADLTTTQAPVRIWVTAARPHRLLKISAAGGAFATVLVAAVPPAK